MRTLSRIKLVLVTLVVVVALGGALTVIDYYFESPTSVTYNVLWTNAMPSHVVYLDSTGRPITVAPADLLAGGPRNTPTKGGSWHILVSYEKGRAYSISAFAVQFATQLTIEAGTHTAIDRAASDAQQLNAHMVAVW